MTDGTNNQPLSHAFVTLLDSAGAEAGRALTDLHGEFFLRAPAPGTYRLQSKRIGFRASISPSFALERGETRQYRFRVEAIPVPLAAVVVTGRPQCGALRGPVVAELWEEIREALAAVSWTSRQPYRYEKVLYERDLDLTGRSVSRERTRRRSGFFETPFQSAPPQRLAREGYVVPEGNTRVFYGPDVDVIRSESFIQTHCFQALAGGDRDSTVIGLSFEPVKGRGVPDIAGTIWVDRKTSELRRLEFLYLNLPPDLHGARLDGEVNFLSLPSGGWVVRDWWIRTPLRAFVETFTERELRVVGLQQTGGRVLGITLGADTVFAANLASLSGTLVDATRGVPLGGAQVELTGTPYTTTTDGSGRFALTGTMEGEYRIRFAHPRLDSLAYAPEPVPVSLRPGAVASVRLTIPPESVIVSHLCPDNLATPDTYILHGVLRDQARQSGVPGAEVRASWQEITGWTASMPIALEGRARPFVLGARAAAGVTDTLGRYLLCGLPSGRRVTLTVARQGRVLRAMTLVHEEDGVWAGDAWAPYSGRIWQHDFSVEPESFRRAAIVGVATDAATGAPLANAMVSLTGVEVNAVTDPAGRATLAGVPPGTHTLVVRRIGYETLERVVTVEDEDSVHVAAGVLALTALPLVLDTVVATGELEKERMLDLVGFYQRRNLGFGAFITRREFERYAPRDIVDVVRQMRAVGVRPNGNYGGPWKGGRIDPRKWLIGPGDGCPALFFLDGVYIGDASTVELEYLLGVDQIEAVEAYTGPARMPVIFNRTGSQCGVIVLWTRH